MEFRTKVRNIISRMLTIASLAVAAVMMATGTPAYADLGGAGSSISGPLGSSVSATGTWNTYGVGGDFIDIAFQCNAQAGGPAIGTAIQPAVDDGCVFVRNGVVVARAGGLGLPGNAAATAATHRMSIYDIQSTKVCWRATALFATGAVRETSGCTNVSIKP